MTSSSTRTDTDRAARLFHRRMLMASGDRLGIVHVMKTAGTSLRSLLSEYGHTYVGPRYLDMRPDFDISDWQTPAREMVMSPEDLADIFTRMPSAMGHILAQSYLDAGATHLVLTVREPRARVISLFRYLQFTEGATSHTGATGQAMLTSTDGSLCDFLELAPLRMHTFNSMAQFMLGTRRYPSTESDLTARLKDVLPYVLAAHWAGDDLALLTTVREFLRLPDDHFQLQHLNVAQIPTSHTSHLLTVEDLAMLNEYTALDSWLLEELMVAGVLRRRMPHDLDLEFEHCARRLGFLLPNHR